MRIPAGDLAPARRRRYGGSYGRRRRRTGRAVLALVAVGLVGGGAYLLQRDDGKAPARITAARPCVTPTPTTARTSTVTRPGTRLPAAGSFQVLLLNGTPRGGLGKKVGDALAARAFTVRVIGNAPPLAGASTVTYGPGGLLPATLVSRHVLGSRLVAAPKLPRGQVRLVLGSGYSRLRTPAELAVLARPTTTTVTAPAARPVASASACP